MSGFSRTKTGGLKGLAARMAEESGGFEETDDERIDRLIHESETRTNNIISDLEKNSDTVINDIQRDFRNPTAEIDLVIRESDRSLSKLLRSLNDTERQLHTFDRSMIPSLAGKQKPVFVSSEELDKWISSLHDTLSTERIDALKLLVKDRGISCLQLKKIVLSFFHEFERSEMVVTAYPSIIDPESFQEVVLSIFPFESTRSTILDTLQQNGLM